MLLPAPWHPHSVISGFALTESRQYWHPITFVDTLLKEAQNSTGAHVTTTFHQRHERLLPNACGVRRLWRWRTTT